MGRIDKKKKGEERQALPIQEHGSMDSRLRNYVHQSVVHRLFTGNDIAVDFTSLSISEATHRMALNLCSL